MLLEYLQSSYMTLMLLTGLFIILVVNRKTKIEGTQTAGTMLLLVLFLSVCDFLEKWCIEYEKPLWILYLKASLVYWIHPLLVILELDLVAPIKRKWLHALVLVPYFVDFIAVFINLFHHGVICRYNENYGFVSGSLHFLPAVTVIFYIAMLGLYSIGIMAKGDLSKSVIVIFMVISTSITVYLEYSGKIVGHVNEVAAFDIVIYYYYLSAIYHGEVQQNLNDSRLELEHRNNELLMAQIQPHFINNSLMAIQARCIDYPEIYESLKNFSRYLRSHFDQLGNPKPVTFEQELRNIKAYLALEKMNFGDRLEVEYDIESEDFLLPSLTIEPLVENAVRHAIAAREFGGTVKIIQRDEEYGVIIEVHDIGKGELNLTDKQEKRRGIGVRNVRARLAVSGNGMLELIQEEYGICARVTLIDVEYVEGSENI